MLQIGSPNHEGNPRHRSHRLMSHKRRRASLPRKSERQGSNWPSWKSQRWEKGSGSIWRESRLGLELLALRSLLSLQPEFLRLLQNHLAQDQVVNPHLTTCRVPNRLYSSERLGQVLPHLLYHRHPRLPFQMLNQLLSVLHHP